MKKKYIVIFLVFCAVIVGITYAWFTWQSSNRTTVSISGGSVTLTVNYDGGPNISGIKLVPASSKDKAVSDGVGVEKLITASSSALTNMDLNLTLETLPQALSHQSLRWEIYKGYNKLGEGNFANKNQGDVINLLSGVQVLPKTSKFKLYIWIDGLQSNPNTMQNQDFKFVLNAKITNQGTLSQPFNLDNSGANEPVLNDAMIPVIYDTENSKWIKADSSNSNSTYQWYDYDAKKWANAVLVKETGTEPNLNEENKTVSIDNTPTVVDKYTSSNQGVASSTSSTTFTFTTGSSSGTLSFDYTVSSENNDKLTVTLKRGQSTSTIISARGGTYDTSYSISIAANTSCVLTVSYVKDSSTDSLDDEATISNINITNLSGNIAVAANGSYGWSRSDRNVYNLVTYSSYNHYDDGTYSFPEYYGDVLPNGNSIIDRYICSDITSRTCQTVYKIKSYSGNTITAVDEYNNSSFTARSTYQSAPVGTEIKEDSILAYYVWVPRYKYKVWNINKDAGTDSYNAENSGIDIVFEDEAESTGTVSCNYDFTITSTESKNETCAGSNGDYYTHPAFTFGNQELTGFWVGKFETSNETPDYQTGFVNTTDLTIRIKPNVASWKNTVTNFWKVIYDMQINNNIYGLPTSRTNTDSHMMKNMEWGAVAYLTHSKYGRCTNNVCTEVTGNNSGPFITGNAGNSVSDTNYVEISNRYDTAAGQLASTTGNIYGIYDMSGGGYDYVMANTSSTSGSYTFNVKNAGNNYTYTGYEKYIDTYAYGTSSYDVTSYNRSRLGDATGEVVSLNAPYGWYNDVLIYFTASSPWLSRGWVLTSGDNSGGVFSSFYSSGGTDSTSTRAVLTVVPSS